MHLLLFVICRLEGINPATITTDISTSGNYMERILADKRTDIWTPLHEQFLTQWTREFSSRVPNKKKEGRLARFLNTVVNSCVEINELLDDSPEIWAAEEALAARFGDYVMPTDVVKGTKQKLNAEGSEHIRLRVVREQFVVHLAHRVLQQVDKASEDDAEHDYYAHDDDDDDDGDNDDDDDDGGDSDESSLL